MRPAVPHEPGLNRKTILGFDAREMWRSESEVWTVHPKESFLLRPSVPKALSVDPGIWAPVLTREVAIRNGYVGFYQELWGDLEALRVALRAAHGRRPLWTVAVVLRADACSGEEQRRWSELLMGVGAESCAISPAEIGVAKVVRDARARGDEEKAGGREAEDALPLAMPFEVLSDWFFLGFDVADMWLQSGLSNCGFLPEQEDVAGLKGAWAPKLNDFHLLQALGEAVEFKELSNRRAEEHAPFFVFELWRVEHFAAIEHDS